MTSSNPRSFNSICIVTPDVHRLREFYTAVLRADAQGDDHFAWIVTSRADLVFYTLEGMEAMAPGCTRDVGYGGCVLEFGVQDVDQEYDYLLSLDVPIVKPPTTQPWGIRSVWFRDPVGNIVNFNAPVPAASENAT
jgi:catechol 2,3-dioxygenase-like lactoylglutathione lyase family enzyme